MPRLSQACFGGFELCKNLAADCCCFENDFCDLFPTAKLTHSVFI